jgi:hypothetical protein
MNESFDPYSDWLQIPKSVRPPSDYELLGLAPGESNTERIQTAFHDRYEVVRKYQIGRYSEAAHEILNELSGAFQTINCDIARETPQPQSVPPESAQVAAHGGFETKNSTQIRENLTDAEFAIRDAPETSLGQATLNTATEEEPNLLRIISGFAIACGIAALVLEWLPYATVYFSSLAFIFGSWHFLNALSSPEAQVRYHYFKAWIVARRERRIARRVRQSKISDQRSQIRKLRLRLISLQKQRSSVMLTEQAALSDLSRRARKDQLDQFLSDHSLRVHMESIPLIGRERLRVLDSCDIRTANDIDYERIMAIPGFSRAVAASLMSWRNFTASQFTFDPETIPQNKVARIVNERIEQRRRIDEEFVQAEDRLRSLHGTLRSEVMVLEVAVQNT